MDAMPRIGWIGALAAPTLDDAAARRAHSRQRAEPRFSGSFSFLSAPFGSRTLP